MTVQGFVSASPGSGPCCVLRVAIAAALTGVGVLAFWSGARAAEADLRDATASRSSQEASVGNIIVTAQRRDEKLTNVPASMIALPGEAIAASGAVSVHELGELVPGLVVTPPVGLTAAVYIRGVGSDSRNIGFDSRVGVFVDGVYVGQSPGLDQDLADVERVEVLRGPQGTFFGKNTVAGAVNIITRAPSQDTEGRFQLRAGNRDSLHAVGSLNLPVTEKVAIRVVASRRRADGTVRNLMDGTMLGNVDSYGVRGKMRADLTPDLSATFTIDHRSFSSHALVAENLTDTFGLTLDAYAPGERQVMLSKTPHERRQLSGASVVLRHRLPHDQELVATTSWRQTRFDVEFDEDWSPARLFEVQYQDRYRNLAQELQLISAAYAPVRYLLGVYYEHQHNFTDRRVPAGADVGLLPFGIAPGAVLSNLGTVRVDSYAAYFNVATEPIKRFEISFGARYSLDRKRAVWAIDGSDIPAFNLATGRLIDRRSDRDISPSLALSYRLGSDARFYVRYAEGYKSGGFNLDFVSADIFPHGLHFSKELARSYEAGFKAAPEGLPAVFSVATFLGRHTNYQVNQFQDLGGGRTAIVISNAASVKSAGVEADLSVRVARAVTMSASAAVLDAHFAHFPGGGTGGADVSGNRLPYASRVQATVSLDFGDIPSHRRTVYPTLHLDLSYRSGFYTSVDNVRSQPLATGDSVRYGYAPGRVVANARIGMVWAAGGLEASIWARNLFDRRSVTWMYRDFLGTVLELTGEPRTFGVEVGWKF